MMTERELLEKLIRRLDDLTRRSTPPADLVSTLSLLVVAAKSMLLDIDDEKEDAPLYLTPAERAELQAQKNYHQRKALDMLSQLKSLGYTSPSQTPSQHSEE